MPSFMAVIAALSSIVLFIFALDRATGGTLLISIPMPPGAYDLVTPPPNVRLTGFLDCMKDSYTLMRGAAIIQYGWTTSILKVCFAAFSHRMEEFYTLLRWASNAAYGPTASLLKVSLAGVLYCMEEFYTLLRWASNDVYGLTASFLKVCLVCFLHRMEEFYTLVRWTSIPAVIGSIIWAIPASKWEALGIAVSIPLQVVTNFMQDRSTFRRDAINVIIAQQERLEQFESGTILSANVKEYFVTKDDANAHADTLQAIITRGADQLKEANSTIRHLEQRNTEIQDDLEDTLNSQTHDEQIKREKAHKVEILRWKDQVLDKEDEIKSLKSQVETWKYECAKHESSTSQQVIHQLEDKIEELENKIQTLETIKQSLSEENWGLRANAFGNERKAANLNTLTELIHEMAASDEMWQRFAVTIFVGKMASGGLNLAEFGIDRTRHETYLQWASDLVANKVSAFNPTEGFRRPVLLLTEAGEDAAQVGTPNS